MITRRSFLTNSAGFAAASTLGSAVPFMANAASPSLSLYGPPVGPSVVLSYIANKGLLSKFTDKVDFSVYKSPDVLRAGFISGDWKLAGTPSYVAANLANKGLPVKMLNIMSSGMLYVLSYDEAVKSPADLAGEKIGMFFRNDMPDLVFGRVMEQNGLTEGKDYTLHYVSTPFEALQLLLSGRIKHCVLPEPAATAGMVKGKQMGKSIHRSIDLANEWASVTGGAGRFPMAGTMVHEDLLNAQPELIDGFHQACITGTEWVKANPKEAAAVAAESITLPAPIIAKSIPYTHLVADRAKEVKAELEQFYSILAEKNPAIIGGRLPDADFYL
ncbi:ABC transporter substrate-binding protein [Pseudovibrio sp. Tun.PSC04-5.I4]|uniref:ABC transporter substrate-binding protein n=1 Tax=Pseudovibrio sp. Tun.PSC04-5.I4 TaxID=1798213 RepID=UPI00088F2AEF|nr:ABC transporter substrate-binding protein [Pseudovibrio sp. Tun.PSC04-5.I4]SDR47719.1 NitT/TauT family transport system substrate-binding protein [Pseudovibrio sp. Tun.PSC04-5.I4]